MEKLFNKKTVEGIFYHLWWDIKDKICISLINKMYNDQNMFINYLNNSFDKKVHYFNFDDRKKSLN
jgi:hypothetical protein